MKGNFILRFIGGVIGIGFLVFGVYIFNRYGFSMDSNSVGAVSAIVTGLFCLHYSFTGRNLRFASGRHARDTTKR
jgi:hypothetical protein